MERKWDRGGKEGGREGLGEGAGWGGMEGGRGGRLSERQRHEFLGVVLGTFEDLVFDMAGNASELLTV